MAVTLTLPTRRTPDGLAFQQLIAILRLTPQRAATILRQMRLITRLAARSVGLYRLTSFDRSAVYVPAHSLGGEAPPAKDFLVIDPNFSPSEVIDVEMGQMSVIPGAVIWGAQDPENLFTVETIELDSDVLRLIARGHPFYPGDTGQSLGYGDALKIFSLDKFGASRTRYH